MLGVGRWKGQVDHPIYKGEIICNITYESNKYNLAFSIENGFFPKVTIISSEMRENTLSVIGKVAMFPGMKLNGSVTFDEVSCSGYVTIPFIGNVDFVGELIEDISN